MYEFHGWVSLRESSSEIDDGSLDVKLERLSSRIIELSLESTTVRLTRHNGRHTLTINGYPNRRRSEAAAVRCLLESVIDLLPGSYGVVYEGDEGVELLTGRGLFTVTTIRRGKLISTLDPFLSPMIPTIEDAE